MNARNLLIYLSLLYKGDWDCIYAHLCDKERKIDPIKVESVADTLKCGVITMVDEDYPQHLKRAFKPPFVLYYYGDISLIKELTNHLGVVGSRNVPEYGVEMTNKIVSGLASKLVIVSGLAAGVDGLAHKACIENGGKTVAVLGSGIDVCFPPDNLELYNEIKKNHLLLSEYPGKCAPVAYRFPKRNRIVAALSQNLLIPYAREKSGSSITAGLVLDMGGDVFCVPTRVGETSLCNQLIKEGGILVESAEDVLNELRLY